MHKLIGLLLFIGVGGFLWLQHRPGRGTESELPNAVEARLRDATVLIETTYRPLDDTISGMRFVRRSSGFFIAEEGLILASEAGVSAVLEYDARQYDFATHQTEPQDIEVYVRENVNVRINGQGSPADVYSAQVLCTRQIPSESYGLSLLRIHPDRPMAWLELLSIEEYERLRNRESESVWTVDFSQAVHLAPVLEGAQPSALDNDRPGSFSEIPAPVSEGAQSAALQRGEMQVLLENGPRDLRFPATVTHSCLVEPAGIGTPLVDATGRVNGVAIGQNDVFEDHNLAVPIPWVWKLFESTLTARSNQPSLERENAPEGEGEAGSLTARSKQPSLERSTSRSTWYFDASTGEIYRFEGFVADPHPAEESRYGHIQTLPVGAFTGDYSLDFCNPGDTVCFSPGEHSFFSNVRFLPTGVWFRGAGAGQTTLHVRSIAPRDEEYIEISDLTIVPADSSEWSGPTLVRFMEGNEAFLHDVEFEDTRIQIDGAPYVNVGLEVVGGAPDITACSGDIRVIVSGVSAAPRLERLNVPQILIEKGASPVVEGWHADEGYRKRPFRITVASEAVPKVRGCRFVFVSDRNGHDASSLLIENGGGAYSSNLFFSDSLRVVLYLNDPARPLFIRNRFMCSHENTIAIAGTPDDWFVGRIGILTGSESQVVFGANLFEACDIVWNNDRETGINRRNNTFIPYGNMADDLSLPPGFGAELPGEDLLELLERLDLDTPQ